MKPLWGVVNYLIKDAEAVMGCDDRSNELVTDIRIEAGKITELGTGLSAVRWEKRRISCG